MTGISGETQGRVEGVKNHPSHPTTTNNNNEKTTHVFPVLLDTFSSHPGGRGAEAAAALGAAAVAAAGAAFAAGAAAPDTVPGGFSHSVVLVVALK